MVPWEVVGDQIVTRYTVMDLGAGHSRVVCTATNPSAQDPFASLRRPETLLVSSHSDPTVNAVLRSSGTLASLAKQSNKLLQTVIVLLLPFFRWHFSSEHDLAPNCSRVFGKVKSISTCARFGSRHRPDGFLQIAMSHHTHQRIMLRTDTDTLLSAFANHSSSDPSSSGSASAL